VVLTYSVQGRLKLSKPVQVKGEKHFSAQKIRDLLDVKEGDPVDEAMLAARGQKVIKAYGEDEYSDVDLKWSLLVENEKSGLVTANLLVKEGGKGTVRSFTVTGCKNIPASVLEKAAGRTAWWSPLGWFESDKFDRDQLESQRLAIKAACMGRGFLDAEVGEPELTRRNKGSYDISFVVREGQLYRIGAVSVKGVTLFPQVELVRLISFKKGSVAMTDEISRTADAIRKYFTDRGYARTQVRAELDARRAEKPGEGVLDIVFNVTEGRLMYVRNVYIRGNIQTQEKVIRRELSILPGDVLAERSVLTSENRLRNLGYFSRVTDHTEPAQKPEEADLVFDVEEQRTGSFMLGGGFSSVDNLVGYFEISEGNFDISSWPPKGAGQKLRLRGQFGSTTSQGNLSFSEPWFLDRRLMLGLDLNADKASYDEYDRESVGGAITLGWPVHFFFDRCEARYALERLKITDISDTNEYTRISGDMAGQPFYFTSTNQLKSSLTLVMTRDTRDESFAPSRGNRISLKGYFAGGILGGDEEIYGWEVRGEQHFSPWARHVLSFKARAEVADEYGDTVEMPISERLFAGGAGWTRGIRGFSYRDVGPKVMRAIPATGSVVYRPIGGRTLMTGSVEYVIPLIEKLKLVLFSDTGNVAEDAYDFNLDSMAASAGVELRLDYRQFPIRVSYAWVLQKDDEHTQEHPWGFSLGSVF
ncbi:MAG: outer membrane protein assembly factor BamA, partial [bacterium]